MKNPPTAERARVSEIFSSLQGEGPHLGERHIFIRFEECHIHCKYCDELGKPAFDKSREEVLSEILHLNKECGPHSYVSFTGGEPLLYLKFIKPLMQEMKEHALKIYLETDGILHPALSSVIDLCDCIAMDLKPSSVTGEKVFIREHEIFLKEALKKEVFIKIVLSKEIDVSEFHSLVEMIQKTAPEVMVVLQPVSTDKEGFLDEELMLLLTQLQRESLEKLTDVRIMPRLHKLMNLR